MRRFAIVAMLMLTGCGSSDPPTVIHEHHIVVDGVGSFDARTPEEKALQDANIELLGEQNRLHEDARKTSSTRECLLSLSVLGDEFDRRGGEDSLEAMQWYLSQVRGKTSADIIAAYPWEP